MVARAREGAGENERFSGERAAAFARFGDWTHTRVEQAFDHVTILLEAEEGTNLACRFRTDLTNRQLLVFGRFLQRLDATEVLGQHCGHVLADLWDAETVDETGERRALAALDRIEDVLRRLVG